MHIAVSTVSVKVSSKYFIIIFFLRRGFRTNPSKPYHAPHMDFVLVCFLFFGLAQWYRGYPRETDETLTLSCTVMQFHVWCFGHIKQPIDLKLPPSRPTHRFFHHERFIISSLRQGRQVKQHSITLVWVACSHSLIPETHLNPRHIGRQRLNSAIFTCVP